MASVQQGTFAVVFGLPTGTSFTFAGSAVGIRATGYDVSREAEKEETRDEDGEIVNIVTFGGRRKVTVQCYPYGSSKANGVTANALPAPGSYAAIISTGSHDTDATAASTGIVYRIDSASKSVTNSGKVTWTLNLERVDGISTYTPLS